MECIATGVSLKEPTVFIFFSDIFLLINVTHTFTITVTCQECDQQGRIGTQVFAVKLESGCSLIPFYSNLEFNIYTAKVNIKFFVWLRNNTVKSKMLMRGWGEIQVITKIPNGRRPKFSPGISIGGGETKVCGLFYGIR